jgi:hypothetical protein
MGQIGYGQHEGHLLRQDALGARIAGLQLLGKLGHFLHDR